MAHGHMHMSPCVGHGMTVGPVPSCALGERDSAGQWQLVAIALHHETPREWQDAGQTPKASSSRN